MDGMLQIKITGDTQSISWGGDMAKVARAVARIGLKNDEFAVALNLAVTGMNEELEAERLRDEMIGFIISNE
jgi:sulfur carrier protein ThiS